MGVLLQTYFCTNQVIGCVCGIPTRTGKDWHKCVSVVTMGVKMCLKLFEFISSFLLAIVWKSTGELTARVFLQYQKTQLHSEANMNDFK